MVVDIDMMQKCVELHANGMTAREIYTNVFLPEYNGMPFNSFRRRLIDWRKRDWPGRKTLDAGTYEGFVAHGATVQVNASGQIVQAWIKQALDNGQWDELLQSIHENATPIQIEPVFGEGDGMLEIPLVDMHLPISNPVESISQLLAIINRKKWNEINVVIGQDMFHNDDFRGRTASGRQIETVDIPAAWEMAKSIWYNTIESALRQAKTVHLIYSAGNHDESLSWAFVQMLKERYPQLIVDDSLKQRKTIYWNGCFIGVTHGHYTKATNRDLRGQFTIEFPEEFSKATVREIHAGHLHRESEGDLYGVMIRRLSRNGETDKWSENEGYVGAHKRYMIFEWLPGRLKAIYYI